jgi:hypothetical protein
MSTGGHFLVTAANKKEHAAVTKKWLLPSRLIRLTPKKQE